MPEPSPTHPPTPTVESVAREKQASKAELMGELSVLYDCIRIAEHGPFSPIRQQLAKCLDLASRLPSTCTEAPTGRWTREPVAEDGWYWMRSPDYDWPAVVTFLRAREGQQFTHWSLPIALPPPTDEGTKP